MSQVKSVRMMLRLFSVVLGVLLLLFVIPFTANAQSVDANDQYIELDGSFEGTFELNINTDLLFHLEEIAPGDSWSGTFHVKNSAPDKMEFAIVSVTSNLEDTLLFDALVTDISIDGEVIYDGTYGFESSEEYMTKFYTLQPGEVLEFDVTVELPRTVGNIMMDREMDSTWVFEANYYGKTPDGPAPTGYDIIVENVSNSPWLLISILAVIGALIIYIRILAVKRRQREAEESTKR